MNKPKAINSKNKNNLLKEIGEALLEMIGGTIASKAGWSIILIAVGSVYVFLVQLLDNQINLMNSMLVE